MSDVTLTIDAAKNIEDQIRRRLQEAETNGYERGKYSADEKLKNMEREIAGLKRELQERYLNSGAAERDLNGFLAGQTIRTVTLDADKLTLYVGDKLFLLITGKGLRFTSDQHYYYGVEPQSPLAPGFCDDNE